MEWVMIEWLKRLLILWLNEQRFRWNEEYFVFCLFTYEGTREEFTEYSTRGVWLGYHIKINGLRRPNEQKSNSMGKNEGETLTEMRGFKHLINSTFLTEWDKGESKASILLKRSKLWKKMRFFNDLWENKSMAFALKLRNWNHGC